jgi:hypothetical protein|eukprot:COSAG01_NODE_11002_length_2029_cov_6.309845_2_plen_83_part_00
MHAVHGQRLSSALGVLPQNITEVLFSLEVWCQRHTDLVLLFALFTANKSPTDLMRWLNSSIDLGTRTHPTPSQPVPFLSHAP